MSEIRCFELNQGWFIAKDAENCGVSKGYINNIASDAIPCELPSIIQQYFPEYHGVAFYFCRFTPEITKNTADRLVLRFGGVDYKANVWLNGESLGEYEGGETPFTFDVTDKVKLCGENLLSVRVVNPTAVTVDGLNLMNTPHRNKILEKGAGSCLNHGGMWYGVTLLSLPAVYIEDKFLIGDIHSGRLTVKLDVRSQLAADESISVCVNVRERTGAASIVVSDSFTYTAQNGISAFEAEVTVPDIRLWSPDDPYLYRVEIILESSAGVHSESLNFGFREMLVKDGYFYLNGKKFFLKCSHSGNAFPTGQMLPVHPELTRRDFILAKACGFNALRSIAGMFRPEQLDIADEVGIMVYEECFASWCMAYSDLYSWDTDKELEAIAKEKNFMPFGDKEKMLWRFDHTTANMIKRDRNHASVVIWGLLNETRTNDIFRRAHDFLPIARELDPTRLVLLGSGRWDEDYSIGSLSNPYSDVWEHEWGEDGNPGAEIYSGVRDGKEFTMEKKRAMGDCHYYAPTPVAEHDIELFRNMGHTNKPVFLSENGIGAMFHVIEEWKEFKARGERLDLEDSGWLEYQSLSLMRDWEALGLDKVYPFAEMMLKESQRLSAEERRLMFDIVRSNPRLCGYSLTGLLDHGMCGEGLWTYWRRMKPEVFDAVSEGWAKLRFCLLTKRHVYSDEEFTFEAVLANEGVLASGEYTARFAVMSERGSVMTFTEKFTLDGNELAVPITKRTLKLDLPSGKYTIAASLDEAAPAANMLGIYVMNKADLPMLASVVYTYGIDSETEAFLKARGADVRPVCDGCGGLVLVGEPDEEIVNKAAGLAEGGATVLFLRSFPFFGKDELLAPLGVGKDLTVKRWHDWLYHKEAVILENTIHGGLGHGLVDFPRYDQTFPHFTFVASEYPDDVICPCFHTGYHGVKGAYGLGYAAMAYRKGNGRIVFNAFGIEGNLGHPAADRLLVNYISYLG